MISKLTSLTWRLLWYQLSVTCYISRQLTGSGSYCAPRRRCSKRSARAIWSYQHFECPNRQRSRILTCHGDEAAESSPTSDSERVLADASECLERHVTLLVIVAETPPSRRKISRLTWMQMHLSLATGAGSSTYISFPSFHFTMEYLTSLAEAISSKGDVKMAGGPKKIYQPFDLSKERTAVQRKIV